MHRHVTKWTYYGGAFGIQKIKAKIHNPKWQCNRIIPGSSLSLTVYHNPNSSMQQQSTTYKTRIAGMYYHPQGQHGLTVGSAVALEREPDNAYDCNAIRVVQYESKVMVGYVARELAKQLAPKVDSQRFVFEPAVVTCVDLHDAAIVFRLLPAACAKRSDNVAVASQKAVCAS
jgi:hypothetical protein